MSQFQSKMVRIAVAMLLAFTIACTKNKNPNAVQSPSDESSTSADKLKKDAEDAKKKLEEQKKIEEQKRLDEEKKLEAEKKLKKEKDDGLKLDTADGFRILDEGLEIKSEDRKELLLEPVLYGVYIYRIHPDKSKIKIVSFQEDATQYKTPKALRDELDAKLVVNGGFFSDSKKPNLADGLLMLEGKKISDSNPKLSGVFAIQEGAPSIIETSLFKIDNNLKPDTSAIQGTPRLIDKGGIIGITKPDLKTTQDKRLKRTAICTLPNNDLLIFVTDSTHVGLYLYELATIAKDHGCDVALNLDGGPASSISVKKYERYVDGHYFLHQVDVPAQAGWVHPNLIVIE